MNHDHTPLTPRPSLDVALYVDFDGVLHHEAVKWHRKRGIYVCPIEAPGRTLFEWAHHLETAVSEFPSVGLVLSSSWCIAPGFGAALKRLSPDLRARFVGGTFHRQHHGTDPWLMQSFCDTPRWRQILSDVERRQPLAWLALDDDIADWPAEYLPNLVACDGTSGLANSSVRAELREKLSSFI